MAFGLGFTPHVQRKTGTDLLLRAHLVDVLLPLAIAPVATLHRIRGGRQQFVVETCQRFLQRRRKEFLQRFPALLEPVETPPQLRQFLECRVRPAAPVEQRRDLLHELA